MGQTRYVPNRRQKLLAVIFVMLIAILLVAWIVHVRSTSSAEQVRDDSRPSPSFSGFTGTTTPSASSSAPTESTGASSHSSGSTGSSALPARVVSAVSADGQPGIGSEVWVKVARESEVSAGYSLWLVIKVPYVGHPPSARFYAKAKIEFPVGNEKIFKFPMKDSTVGSTRDFLIVLADPTARPSLEENLANDGVTAWDVKRDVLPTGTKTISTLSVEKTRP